MVLSSSSLLFSEQRTQDANVSNSHFARDSQNQRLSQKRPIEKGFWFLDCPVYAFPMQANAVDSPRILTSTVGSYPAPDWLAALPSEQALLDATRVVFNVQRQAGIELPTDGELYRFDVNHPDTNGMIDYFVRRLGGIRSELGRL